MKCSIKFDNEKEGRARFSIKMGIENSKLSPDPKLYLLICNKENPVFIHDIDTKYHNFLINKKFKRAAGIINVEDEKEFQEYIIKKIKVKKDDQKDSQGNPIELIYLPKTISIKKIDPDNTEGNFTEKIISGENDIIEIIPIINVKDMEKTFNKQKMIIEFQYRIYFDNYVSHDTLTFWESSFNSWSIDIDIQRKINHEEIITELQNFLLYPELLDLWINIPHNHLFIASSPVHKGAIKLKDEDIRYKTYNENEDEKKIFFEKFKTLEGDYSVWIQNKNGPEEFSVICLSPFLSEEEPGKLREDINEFKEKSKELEKKSKELEQYERNVLRNMVGIFGIFVAIFSFITIGVNSALLIQIPQYTSILDIFLYVSAFLAPIFIFLLILLIITGWFIRK
jgi:hypothetical protein